MALSGTLSTKYSGWTYRINWSATQSVADNKSTVTCTHQLVCASGYDLYIGSRSNSCTAGGVKKSFTSSAISTTGGTTITLGKTTHDITHNADGTKVVTISGVFNIEATLAGTYKGSIKVSGSVTLDTIPRGSTLTVGNGTLGVEQTMTITEKASSFTHKVTAEVGNILIDILDPDGSDSTSLSFKWTPPKDLATHNKTGTSLAIKYLLRTYSGSTWVDSESYTKTLTIPDTADFRPKCSLTLTDVNGWETKYGAPVQGLSKMKVKVTTTLAYGSAIASYTVNANGAKYTQAEITTEALKSSGSNTFSATIKDKRGRSASASTTRNVLAYKTPNISKLTVHRCNQDGTENDQGDYVQAKFSATVTALNNKNTASYKIRYKKSTEDSYTEKTLNLSNSYSVSNYAYTFAADNNSSYDVEVEVKDDHRTVIRSTSASTAFTLMNWGEDGNSMGIFKVAEKPGYLEIGQTMEVERPIELAGVRMHTLELTSNFTPYGGDEDNQPKAIKNAAGMVELVGRVSPTTALADLAATAGVLICTLPAGFRPATSFTALEQGGSAAVWLLTVETNGQVKASRYRKGGTYEVPDTAAWLPFHQVFFTQY